MDNSFFVYASSSGIAIGRFHICTWEFRNGSCFLEIGIEITADSLIGKDNLDLDLFIPWYKRGYKIQDYYSKLKDSSNSRFIFNDSITASISLDGGRNNNGVIHRFSDKQELCILPLTKKENDNNIISVSLDLRRYQAYDLGEADHRPNVYVRFAIYPGKYISTRKKGITKSTILYDIKLNQRRNLPDEAIELFAQKHLCNVKTCFCFNIIPNSYDLSFFDTSSLKNVRSLEYPSFKEYIDDDRVKEDDLIVVFNKKEGLDSYSFFSIYTKEHIGADQFALALFISLVSGILLFIPAYQISLPATVKKLPWWEQMPVMFWVVIALLISTLLIISWSRIIWPFARRNKK